ncbi:MAG: hypothetical protein QOJ38_1995 [Solirubrobacterales bacterium]|nr:hypothetical protein [Solirubrobacterales bacterium]
MLALACLAARPPLTHAASLVDELRAMCSTPPDYEVIRADSYSAAQQQSALDGRFKIFDSVRILHPPVNWRQTSRGSRTFEANLQNLTFLDILFDTYRNSADAGKRTAALAAARDLALDWIAHNARSGKHARHAARYAWSNPKVVGDRAGYLAYLARAAACEPGILSDSQAATLISSLRLHIHHLIATPRPSNDFPLYMDFGLAVMADQLPFLPEAASSASLAERGFATGIARRLSSDGVWLEHSVGYHFFTERLLDKFIEFTGTTRQELLDDLAAMKGVAPWFVEPDGLPPQWGDTDLRRAPDYALNTTPAGFPGLAPTARSGYGIVKTADAYMGVTAGYFSRDHKQADDGSFDLFDRGHRIVSDSGKFDYAERGQRDFAISAPAHSVLTVDGQDFPIAGSRPYRSGIVGTGQSVDGSGWYAVMASNPLVKHQRASHLRLVLFKPGVALIVVDHVASHRRHVYRRYVQLGPDVQAERIGHSRSFALTASNPAFSGLLYDAPSRPHLRGITGSVAKGRRSSRKRARLGFTFPLGRRVVPRPTVIYRSQAKSATYAMTLSIDSTQPIYTTVLNGSNGFTLRLLRSTGTATTLTVGGSGVGGLGVTESVI